MDIPLESVLLQYTENVRVDLSDRWNSWPLDLSQNEVHEVVGALLARQVTLATNFAKSPGVWNAHIAPIFLRCMAAVYISLNWILQDPLLRSKKYILYGLGQAKLQIEHRKAEAEQSGKDPKDDPMIEILEGWVNSQRYLFLTEVEIGSWSGLSTREMAEEASCLDYYRYVYMPFSASVHSTWHHIGRLNLTTCLSPLHRAHHIPVDPKTDVDLYYLYLMAKYLDKTFRLFDDFIKPSCDKSVSLEKLTQSINELKSQYEEDNNGNEMREPDQD